MAEMIYFDNNATTRPLPEVVAGVAACLAQDYANPSSVHQFGQAVRHRVECARAQVASLVGADAKEIVFTSGGTESINLAIRGALGLRPNCRRIVTTAVEHSAVLRVVEHLEKEGYDIIRVGVDNAGRLDEAAWAEALTENAALATLVHVNNETGVVFDVKALAQTATDRGVPVHVDAVQSAGKMPIDMHDWGVALASFSAHKFHGPKGTGALYVRRRTRLTPLILGGSQERLLRGGTEHVPGIVGMGIAADRARQHREADVKHVAALRDAFEAGILERVSFARINGREAPRIHNTSNVSFEGLGAEAILILLSESEVCASAGSACSSGSLEPSHVLLAMGIADRFAHGAVRFSFSRFNTREEVDRVLNLAPGLLSRLTALSR